MTETFDPSNASQALAASLRISRRELRDAAADITFARVEDPLAESELIVTFAASFSSMVFASFEVNGMNRPLARKLKSIGNGVRGYLDPYVQRFLSSEAMRVNLPELAINEADALIDSDCSLFEALDPLLLDGSLAMAIHEGGPYPITRPDSIADTPVPIGSQTTGTYHPHVVPFDPYEHPSFGFNIPSSEAFRLAHEFRTGLIGDRFDDLHIAIGHGWSDWFIEEDIWNHGWLMTDLRDARVHLLCATDTD